ncbi:hypothetical protein L9F63_014953, partial [Diploptera punctata]
ILIPHSLRQLKVKLKYLDIRMLLRQTHTRYYLPEKSKLSFEKKNIHFVLQRVC